MPPLLQGHRVTLEGKFKHISFYQKIQELKFNEINILL